MLLYQIAITLIPGIGDINAKKLIAYCGSAEAVFQEKKTNLMKIPGMGKATVESIKSAQTLERAEQEIDFIEKNNIRTYYYLDKSFPQRLKHCIDSPVLIYLKGNADLNCKYVVGMVGTRRATEYGRDMCESLLHDLADLDVLVVSGLAYGIDTQSHKSALDNGLKTVGVLAHGLDRVYPNQNYALSRKMMEQGGLLSDFMSGTNPDRENFPKRNRIIAGLCDALVVVESAKKGGALITANIANSYNRDVFAVPGRINDLYSEGCNYLVKTNKAALIQSADDLKYIMQWDSKSTNAAIQTKLFRELNKEEDIVMDILKENGETSIDFIVLQSKLSNSKIAAILLNLEFDGLVKSLPGKMFRSHP
ncbi:MAG: DNA-processing protein DprA [Bacteroidales bacterium]|nr:DNA-processing protein DprA [Bacteroidales bacterium]